jgi:CSLREA domain-containing protein
MKKIAVTILLLALYHQLMGLNIVVTSINDAVDISIGNGICGDGTGECTLRAAIQEINAFGDANNSITIPAGIYTLSLTGANENDSASGDLDCNQSVTITGANARTTIIDGNGTDRVFHLLLGTITISKVSIINGRTTRGGGILNFTNVSLSEVTINNCRATRGLGGGVFNSRLLTISKSTFSENIASGGNGKDGIHPGGGGGGGGGAAMGGAIYNTMDLIIENTTISGNTAIGGRGGNGSWHAGSGTVTSPGGTGGGINGGAEGGNNTNGNNGGFGSGGGGGGSISGTGGSGGFGGGGAAGGANSWGGNAGTPGTGGTYGGNGQGMCCSASGGGGGGAGLGGGIFNRGGTIDLENVTLVLNSTTGGNGGSGYWFGAGGAGQGVAGGIFNRGGTVSFMNTIIANNAANSSDPDLNGSFISNNYNIILETGSSIITGITVDNIIGQDPGLGMLTDNGGETDTHAIACGGVAHNTGQTIFLLDQRCEDRTLSAPPDIGAFELNIDLGFKKAD